MMCRCCNVPWTASTPLKGDVVLQFNPHQADGSQNSLARHWSSCTQDWFLSRSWNVGDVETPQETTSRASVQLQTTIAESWNQVWVVILLQYSFGCGLITSILLLGFCVLGVLVCMSPQWKVEEVIEFHQQGKLARAEDLQNQFLGDEESMDFFPQESSLSSWIWIVFVLTQDLVSEVRDQIGVEQLKVNSDKFCFCPSTQIHSESFGLYVLQCF